MKYSEHIVENKNFLKRFSHKRRFDESANFLNEFKNKQNTSLLDFGCGNGYFLSYLKKKKFDFDLSAYDPVEEQILEMKELFKSENIVNINIYKDYDLIKDKFDIICCFETLEHFGYEYQKKLIKQMMDLLNPGGTICISVPLEVYLSGFLKIISRVIMGQSQENTNLKNTLKTLFGLPIEIKKIQENQYSNTHIGFYYFNLIKLIKTMNLKIIETKYSPIPIFKSFINSQVFLKIKLNK